MQELKTKLQILTMIQSFQVMNQGIMPLKCRTCGKVQGLLENLKKMVLLKACTNRKILKNFLNGIKDFVEGKRELADPLASLPNF